MPTYDYICDNRECALGNFERLTSMSSRNAQNCPVCGVPARLKVSVPYFPKEGSSRAFNVRNLKF